MGRTSFMGDMTLLLFFVSIVSPSFIVSFLVKVTSAQSSSELTFTASTLSAAPSLAPVISDVTAGNSGTITTSTTASLRTSFSFPSSLDDTDSDEEERSLNLANLYFFFLALFWLFVVVAFIWVRRRRRMLRAKAQHDGQHALARDLEGWVNTRRWIRGNWMDTNGGSLQRGEWLNERGEAPPPYKAQDDSGLCSREGVHNGSGHLAVPLSTLSRNNRAFSKPPGYEECTLSSRTSRQDLAAGDAAQNQVKMRHLA